jgi:hypothetical protein
MEARPRAYRAVCSIFMRSAQSNSVQTCARTLVVGLALVVLLGGTLAYAQGTGASANQKFTISGSVVNGSTGEGIPRAMVTLQGSPMRSTFTDNSGGFVIEGVAAGRYSLQAQKPGYFGTRDRSSGAAVQTVDVGPNSDSATLKLGRENVIFGRLTDPNGQPVEAVGVHLTQRVLRNGIWRMESRSMANSDDDGGYRFANLQPGTYYVSAGPDIGRREALFGDGNMPRMGWPAVYYPQAPDAASAAPVRFTSGQQVQADMVMNRVPLYTVSGVAMGFAPGQGVSIQVQNSSGDMVTMGARVRHDSGEFELHLPAGTYRLKAMSHVEGQPLVSVVRITVEKDLNQLQLVLQPAISIPVHARLDDRSQGAAQSGRSRGGILARDAYNSPPLSVHLISLEPGGSDVYSVNRGAQGNYSLALGAVEPGRYAAEVTSYGGWYVDSAQCGNANLLSEDLVVTAGNSCSIEIVLRNDGGTLSAKVEATTDIGPGMALLVPARGRATPRSLPFYVADGAHEAQMSVDGIAPGEYLLYPFDDPTGVEYSNPEVLRSHTSQATAVTISPGQTAKVTAQLIHTGAGEE